MNNQQSPVDMLQETILCSIDIIYANVKPTNTHTRDKWKVINSWKNIVNIALNRKKYTITETKNYYLKIQVYSALKILL